MADERPPEATEETRTPEDALLGELRAHPARRELGALALDVLGRQAEGRTLFVGREHVRKRAAEHGASRETAGTSLCNVVDLLERGAESDRERALLCALAVLGLADAMERDAEGASGLLGRTVRHAVWLEVATGFALLDALATQSEGELADRIAGELTQRLVDQSVGPRRRSAHDRAASAALVTALRASSSPRASEHLSALATHEGLDPVVRAMAGELAPGSAPAGTPQLSGPPAPAPRTGVRALLAWVSGWALVSWAWRAALALLGRAGSVSVAIRGHSIEVQESSGLLGRSAEERRSLVPVTSILAAGRTARHVSAVLYASAAAMAAGILVGGYLVFDGLRSGELVIASVGAAIALAGVGLDVGLDVASRLRGAPRVVVELVLPRGRVVRLLAADEAGADAFLEALRARLR